MKISFQINGKKLKLETSPKRRLLDILREDLNLTGTKEGCGKGECGACSVLYNGKIVNSCLVPAMQLEGAKIVTVEGLKNWPVFQPIEKAYLENGAVQCGFCIAGFVMSTAAFLHDNTPPISGEKIKNAVAGNICRCTGYAKILEAINELANQPEIVRQIQKDWSQTFEQ